MKVRLVGFTIQFIMMHGQYNIKKELYRSRYSDWVMCWMTRCSNSGKGKIVVFYENSHTVSGAHPACYSTGTGNFCRR